jgi:hypothetical protein
MTKLRSAFFATNLHTTAVLIIAVGTLYSAVAGAQDRYGAIAFSESSGADGWSSEHPTRHSAEQRALKECALRADDCQVVVWFHNACGALAVGTGNAWGANGGNSRQAALTAAMRTCSDSADDCKPRRWVCRGRTGPEARALQSPDVRNSYACAYPGQYERQSLNHNGSIMSLVEGDGGSRIIYYQAPRSAMAELGVRQGTLLFQGYEANGHWLGTAYVFKRGCLPIPYHVEGSLQSNYYGGRYVRLRGPAPFEYIGCTPFSYSWDHNSDLVFDYLEPREAE